MEFQPHAYNSHVFQLLPDYVKQAAHRLGQLCHNLSNHKLVSILWEVNLRRRCYWYRFGRFFLLELSN